MNDVWQEAIKESYASAPSDVIVYETLEIRQEGVQNAVYIVRAVDGITATDENGLDHDFEPAAFQVTIPPANEEGVRSLNIAIDNIDRRVSDFIDLAKSEVQPVTVIYRPYVSTDLSTPQMDPPLVLTLKDINITPLQVTGKATFMDLVNRKFPSEIYTRLRFPALG